MRLTDNEMTLATLLAGGSLTIVGAWLERVWRRRDDQDRRAAELETARRVRVESVLDSILIEQARARVIIQDADNDEVIENALHDVAEQIDRLSAALPDEDLRDALEDHSGILWWADEIAEREKGDTSPAEIAWYSANRIGQLAGAALRGEPMPGELPILVARRVTFNEIVDERNAANGHAKQTDGSL